MTDDLVARLRHEQELCTVMGDTASGALVGEAADALEAKDAECSQALTEQRRRLCAEHDKDRAELKRVRQVAKDEITAAETRVRELEAELAEAYERAAKVAASYDDGRLVYDSQGHTMLSRHGNRISAAIRKLAQEVKHEAE